MYNEVAITPFNTSTNITKLPHLGPNTLKELVAPALPLPKSLISNLKTDLLIHTEVGIDPIKYAKMTKIDSFIVS